jgi:hypothetical protein
MAVKTKIETRSSYNKIRALLTSNHFTPNLPFAKVGFYANDLVPAENTDKLEFWVHLNLKDRRFHGSIY